MALTPEDIVNRTFETTRFRDGYDQDEVDNFLDEIVTEFRAVIEEKERLEARVRELESGDASGSSPAATAPAAVAASAPEADAPAAEAPEAAAPEAVGPEAAPAAPARDANASSSVSPEGLLALAQRVHDEHVAEGERRKGELVGEGEERKTALEQEAIARRAELDREFEKTSKDLEKQKTQLETKIDELKSFERDYRLKLRGYIESQLRDLDRSSFAFGGSSAPAQ